MTRITWERVRFKNLNREFIGRLNSLQISKHLTNIYYAKIEQVSSHFYAVILKL